MDFECRATQLTDEEAEARRAELTQMKAAELSDLIQGHLEKPAAQSRHRPPRSHSQSHSSLRLRLLRRAQQLQILAVHPLQRHAQSSLAQQTRAVLHRSPHQVRARHTRRAESTPHGGIQTPTEARRGEPRGTRRTSRTKDPRNPARRGYWWGNSPRRG